MGLGTSRTAIEDGGFGGRTVIVGGGFGGLAAARVLGRAGRPVTLIDKRNFKLFQPLLYQVASGQLAAGDIAVPTRSVLRGYPSVQVLQTTAYDVDLERRCVLHEHGELYYDQLVVASGVKHHYFGRDEWKTMAPGLKTLEHALDIRRRIFDAFERAELSTDEAERRALMTFVVVGAGPTGVELAGAIGELAQVTLRKEFRSIDPGQAQVLLLEGGPRVLPSFAPELSAAALKHLQALGVTVYTSTMVKAVETSGVAYERDTALIRTQARTVLWAAGVRASAFGEALATSAGMVLDRSGRLPVESDFSLPGYPGVYVIGDLARVQDATGADVPGLAPAAEQAGVHVARRIAGLSPTPFVYQNRGSMAVIGTNRAVGQIQLFGRGVQVTGGFGWFIWAFVHIAALVGPEQRLRVFMQWSWRYLTRRTGDRLITGQPTNTRALQAARRDPVHG